MQCELCLCDKCVIERQLQSEQIDGLREAVKVLADVAVVLKDVQDGDELWFGDFTVSRVAKVMSNPIAAAAVREAGK